MKAATYAALLLGALSCAMGQTTADPGPSPTESIGCVAHNDHWDCEGPRVTDAVVTTSTGTAPVVPTTAIHHDHDDDDDHDHDHDHTDDEDDHTDSPGTGSIKPSPTESYGCESHGDHWHCEGHRTASSALVVVTTATNGADSEAATTTTSTSTAGAAQVTGLSLAAGVVALVAMAL
ncbi:hypothetical protein QBC40DRAFT_303913 [Triangularia verruculosa]|uniref:Uncharacterized protein n=1 Tax=Triangularia verruculosa TaxID=2587418 RepID=A0AAN6XQN7_9PEZI|nr:hypothetical protein QBC40DRAFT_303913 [Triangularia verruculosa]